MNPATHPDKLSLTRTALVSRLQRHHARLGQRLLGPRGRTQRTEWCLIGANSHITRRWPDFNALEAHARELGLVRGWEVVS